MGSLRNSLRALISSLLRKGSKVTRSEVWPPRRPPTLPLTCPIHRERYPWGVSSILVARCYSTAVAHTLKPDWEEGGAGGEKKKGRKKEGTLKDQPSSSHEKEKEESAKVPLYAKYLKWTPVPLFALLTYNQYRRLTELETVERSIKHWEITCYRMLPWKVVSRVWGWINSVQLPVWARAPFLSWYAKAFGCDVCEAEVEDLSQYKNLGEFFRRRLKEGVRPVNAIAPIVSPADGTVLHFGKVQGGIVEQVKGVSYSLATFLGPPSWMDRKVKEGRDYASTLISEGNSLYHCVIYLAPGDYHRFHSPVNWAVNFRRHFAGELLSVNPRVASWISGLFSLNERAVYLGKWKHGFFSMTAVGATNVGSIKVYQDKELLTNSRKVKKNTFADKVLEGGSQGGGVKLRKGDAFGEFNLGSTIVLIFEAPANYEFSLKAGEKIRVGEALTS